MKVSLTIEMASTNSKKKVNKDHDDLNRLIYEIIKQISDTDSYCHKVQLTLESWAQKERASFFEV